MKKSLWFYALFALPLAFAELPLFINVPKFYHDQMTLSLVHIGTILCVVRILDALKDPFVGLVCDMLHKGPRSRHRFMAIFIPLFALAFWALWNPPSGSYEQTMWWFGLCLLAVHMADGALIIAYYSLGAEISDDYHGRTQVTSLRESFRIGGLLVAAVLPSYLSTHFGVGEAFSIFSIFFVIMLAGLFALFFFKSPSSLTFTPSQPQKLWAYIEALKDRSFLWIATIHMLNVFAFAVPTALFAFFVADVVGTPHLEGMFLAIYFLSGIAGMMMWSKMSKRMGKKTTLLSAFLMSLVVFSLTSLMHSGNVILFGLICVGCGLTFGADLALLPSLLADVIDERKEGESVATGAYFGVWCVTAKMATGIAAGMAFPLLAWMGYQGGEGGGAWALQSVYAFFPSIIKGITAWLLYISPLDQARSDISLPLTVKTV